jgi:hypothetical protein
MPPAVPKDRLTAMRKALLDTLADPAFKAEADKMGLLVNAPQTGEQIERVVRETYALPDNILTRVREIQQPGN